MLRSPPRCFQATPQNFTVNINKHSILGVLQDSKDGFVMANWKIIP